MSDDAKMRIVVEHPGSLTREAKEAIEKDVRDKLGEGVRVVVIDSGMRAQVLPRLVA